MPDILKDRLNSGIATVRALVAAHDLAGAEALIATLVDDPDLRKLGPQTALGLPRRLHAVLLHLAKAQGDPVRRAGYQFHLVPPPSVLAPLFTYSLAEKRAINLANTLPVPRVIHQIWIGDLPVPSAVSAWQHHATAQGYGYRLWQEADLADLGLDSDPVFAAMRARGDFPGAVDVARYAILSAEGGIYLDCDWYPAQDALGFHDVLPLVGLTAMAEDTPRLTGQGGVLLANSFIATPPGHPAIARICAALSAALQAMPSAPAWWSTGPLVFTLAARGGTVNVAPHSLVAANFAPGTNASQIEAAQAAALHNQSGLLIGWKSW